MSKNKPTIEQLFEETLQSPRNYQDDALRKLICALAEEDWLTVVNYSNRVKAANLCTKGTFENAVREAAKKKREELKSPKSTSPYRIRNLRLYHLNTTLSGLVTETPVADFYARIVKDITNEDGHRSFGIKGRTTKGISFSFEIPADDFADERNLRSALINAAGASSPIWAGMTKHLGPAIQFFSTPHGITQINQYERTGWLKETFLIPGREQTGIEIHLPRKLPFGTVDNAVVGKGLCTADSFLASINISPIIFTFILQAPLARLIGWGNERYGLFIEGLTGTLKTSSCQLAMAIYGPKFVDDSLLLKWGEGATRNAIIALASHAHDLPLLIDNYKPNTGGGYRDFIQVVHNILEGGEKERLTRASKLRETKQIHCWPLMTGEDLPNNDAASLSRLLIARSEWPRGKINNHLAEVQKDPYHLSSIGKVWLDWLELDSTKKTLNGYSNKIDDKRAEWSKKLVIHQSHMANPLRVATNLATNEITWDIICQHPQIGSLARKYQGEYYSELEKIATRMANFTTESLEALRLLETLRELIINDRYILQPMGTTYSGPYPDRVLGWRASNQSIYLLPDTTRVAIEKVIGQDGLNRISNHTLYIQLKELGMIESHDKDRNTKKIRHGNKTVNTLHLKEEVIS